MLKPLLMAGLVLTMAQAQARDCRGAQFPDHTTVQGANLTLNGLGLRTATVFNVQVYVVALYVGRESRDPRQILDAPGPTQLIMHFLRGLSARQIRDAFEEGLTRQGTPQQMEALKTRLAQLSAWTSDMKSGQRMTFTRIPGEGLTVVVDGQPKGTIPGDDFARAFLGIWLGEHPPTLEVKSGMLGGSCG